MSSHRTITRLALSTAISTALLAFAPLTLAQDDVTSDQDAASEDLVLEEIIVSGIRSSLANSVETKRNSDNLIEAIYAEDIGKLPDQNLAEVLENVTGVQITRRAGVGTGVQIRGTNANRVEINGVSTTGSGAGRSGINFEDVNASIISAVEVIKAPEAKTIEGSVGGTINLKTIRPLQLTDTLGAARLQFEDSSLATESWQPRISGAYGDRWETDSGDFGFVISGSYTKQEAVSFRPRTDRDNLTSIPGAPYDPYMGIQFFVQEQENDRYETTNLSTTLEWAPNDNLTFHADVFLNKQERYQDSYRLQASGVSTSAVRLHSVPIAFEIVDFGVGPGTLPAAYQGWLEPRLDIDDDDPNLRMSSDTGARVTDSEILAFGGEWQGDKFFASFELASTSSDSEFPNLSTTLNFMNPQCPWDGSSNDNCVPFIYDLSGKSLAWGINPNSQYTPSSADLLDPASYVLDQVIVGENTTDNTEDALRFDFTYDLDWAGLTGIDFGARWNDSSSEFNLIEDRLGGFSKMVDSPNGTLFSELLVTGPRNFNAADGRSLFIRDFLLPSANRAFNDRQNTIDIYQNAIIQHDPDSPDILDLSPDENAYYKIKEETIALYAQANFGWGNFRGNLGVRYLDTEITSTGYGPEDANGVRHLESTKGSYDFVLPRLNVVWEPTEELLVRFGYSTDIRRPDFNELATGFDYDNQENSVIALGNPGLEPEEVDSIDLSVEWYFAPAAVVSVGYFTKDRTNIFGIDYFGAALIPDPDSTSGLSRETDPSCPGGGIWNPTVIPNVLGDPDTVGLCVDYTIPGNDPDTTTQSGWEFAFQYDFAEWEDKLGWASGFGVIANYTIQDFSGGSIEDCTSGRGLQVLGDVCIDRGLLDFSEDAYNFTLYYEKYGLSARMRYTWREAFRTQDFAAGANTSGSSTFSFPVWTLDRAQLNASIFYAVTDHLDVGLEGVNLLENEIYQHCVSKTGPLCFVGYPDRRLVLSAAYRF